ncbi:MAG: TMEM175 family protein [Bacteroidota bacterium]
MNSGRLEAFSDGVLAIIITIMVLEMKAPEETTIEALIPSVPILSSYLISFIYIGTYWNNHHHLFQITEEVNGQVLWANLHLLFWLSLIPFATSWVGENHIEALPVALYGFILLMSGIAYSILQNKIIQNHPEDFPLRQVVNGNRKEKLSLLLYLIGVLVSFVNPWVAILSYITVLIMWFIPDKQIENFFKINSG